MKRLLILCLVAIVAGCAKFPTNGATNNVTRISFMMRVQGKINTTVDEDPGTNYIYLVGIRTATEDNPDPQTNPQPVFSAPHPNGFVQGQPTHFVQFDTINPNATYPFHLYQFAKTGDPNNPIDLSTYTEVNQPIINFTRPDPGSGVLKFDLYLNQLADSQDAMNNLKFLQVNFLTMNKTARETTSGRMQDYLGDNNNASEVNKAITIDLRTNTIRQNDGIYEPQGDTSDPDLDIVDWSIQVTRP